MFITQVLEHPEGKGWMFVMDHLDMRGLGAHQQELGRQLARWSPSQTQCMRIDQCFVLVFGYWCLICTTISYFIVYIHLSLVYRTCMKLFEAAFVMMGLSDHADSTFTTPH